MPSRQRFALLLFALLLGVTASAGGRKRDRSMRSSTGAAALVEPDAMVARAMPARSVPAVTPFNSESAVSGGHINTSYREGIDVSHYQGTIDWDRVVKAGQISYAYLKATEGATYVDDTYEYNLREARRVGLSVGSYHFYRPNVSPRDQFDNIVRTIRADQQDLVPIIDIEHRGNVSEEKFIADLTQLLQMVEKHYGKKPLLYSYQNFYNRHFAGRFSGYHWMIAKYQDEEPVLTDGRDYIMWQYTSKGSLDGIRGHVDRSCLMGSYRLGQVGL